MTLSRVSADDITMKARVDSLAVAALVIALATGGITMTLVTGNLAMAVATGHAEAAARHACDFRLDVESGLDVPNTRGGNVLRPLLKNPLFPLTWICRTDSGILVELTGPDPVYGATAR
jgi:hypothetical protein